MLVFRVRSYAASRRPPLATRAVSGHTGHLCAVCEKKYAYQGVFCSRCADGSTFQEWPAAKAVALILFGVLLLAVVTFLLFFLPIFPRLEQALARLIQPAVNRVGEVVSGMVARRSRPSAARLSNASRVSAARLSADGRLSGQHPHAHAHAHHPHLSARPNSPLRPASATMRPTSNRVGGKDAPTPHAHGAERGKRKLAAVLDVVAEPLRIIVRCGRSASSVAGSIIALCGTQQRQRADAHAPVLHPTQFLCVQAHVHAHRVHTRAHTRSTQRKPSLPDRFFLCRANHLQLQQQLGGAMAVSVL
jgi:predicted nucleic acid-binding Zn ribbon protein